MTKKSKISGSLEKKLKQGEIVEALIVPKGYDEDVSGRREVVDRWDKVTAPVLKYLKDKGFENYSSAMFFVYVKLNAQQAYDLAKQDFVESIMPNYQF
ncbi:hypothetical protein HY837_05915 [archaeon]|nr:hypothetical protein [archaeon]